MQNKRERKIRRHKKIRARIHGTQVCPRFYVFKSLKHIYGQLIDDEKARVLLSLSDRDINPVKNRRSPQETKKKGTKVNIAKEVGRAIAKKAAEKKIEKVVFDRGGIVFHGRIKALAEGAREGGLKF